MFEAYEAETEAEAIKLAKKALKIYPQNFDAQNLISEAEEKPIKRLEMFKETLKQAEQDLKEQGMFEECNIGIFYGLLETRPYMRTKHLYVLTLLELGRYTEAANECEEMLKLCENDNLGVRYILMGLYALLEKMLRQKSFTQNIMKIMHICCYHYL